MDSLDRWEQRQKTRSDQNSGMSARARELRAKNAPRVAAANAAHARERPKIPLWMAGVLAIPVGAVVAFCIATGGDGGSRPEPTVRVHNSYMEAKDVTRTECNNIIRAFSSADDQSLRTRLGVIYNKESGCAQAFGSMAQVQGVSR